METRPTEIVPIEPEAVGLAALVPLEPVLEDVLLSPVSDELLVLLDPPEPSVANPTAGLGENLNAEYRPTKKLSPKIQGTVVLSMAKTAPRQVFPDESR